MGWDRATFRDKGTEVSSLYRDKGTTGQAQNLTKGQEGLGQPKFGTGRARTAKTISLKFLLNPRMQVL